MREVYSGNNVIKISYIQSMLSERNIEFVVLDDHTAGMYGGALMERRVMVADEDYETACRVLADIVEEVY